VTGTGDLASWNCIHHIALCWVYMYNAVVDQAEILKKHAECRSRSALRRPVQAIRGPLTRPDGLFSASLHCTRCFD